MKQITILGIQHTIATTVFGPMDVFSQAGLLWNTINDLPLTPHFTVKIATIDGSPVTCLNNAILTPHLSVDDIDNTDLVIIPSIANVHKTIEKNRALLDWIMMQYKKGAGIASVCTGAFFLAETGLLDGRSATTHWGFVDQFTQMYPAVNLKPERLITDEGNLYCAGALGAGIDLSLYLVEKFCGREIAIQCAKSLIHDTGRSSQAPYRVFRFQKNHSDEEIRITQEWIEANFSKEINVGLIADRHGMTRRTFERRFKNATGDTPLNYIQRTRVEKAKQLLENAEINLNEICRRVGYEDSSHFRAVFKKHTGLLPSEYQKKFIAAPG